MMRCLNSLYGIITLYFSAIDVPNKISCGDLTSIVNANLYYKNWCRG